GLYRAHRASARDRAGGAGAACDENLPLFGAVVLVATVVGVKGPGLDTLARVYLAARVAQSITHITSGSATAINVRFTAPDHRARSK
ncbi:MAG: MAPEG family protein, partial [Candidatus Binatia bacterium]